MKEKEILHTSSIIILGPWTSSGIEVLGTFHSTLQGDRFSKPDLQLMILPLGISTNYGIVLKEAMGISDEVII